MKILVVDDHPLFLEALGQVLQQLSAAPVVLKAGNCDEALRLAAEHADFGLILLDICLPGTDGFATLALLRERHAGVPIVILSASENAQDIRRAIDGGAAGYIPKFCTSQVILGALRLVLSGGVYVPAMVLMPAESKSNPQGSGAREEAGEVVLTARQRDVLRLMCSGEPNKRIAQALGMADGTVRIHVTAIFKALKVVSRTQAIVAVQRLGLVADE